MFLMSGLLLNLSAEGKGAGESLTVSVSGTVDVTVVPVLGLILDVRRVDSDTTSTFLRGLVNVSVVGELSASTLGEDFGDSSGQSGLSVIDVT